MCEEVSSVVRARAGCLGALMLVVLTDEAWLTAGEYSPPLSTHLIQYLPRCTASALHFYLPDSTQSLVWSVILLIFHQFWKIEWAKTSLSLSLSPVPVDMMKLICPWFDFSPPLLQHQGNGHKWIVGQNEQSKTFAFWQHCPSTIQPLHIVMVITTKLNAWFVLSDNERETECFSHVAKMRSSRRNLSSRASHESVFPLCKLEKAPESASRALCRVCFKVLVKKVVI